MTEAPQGAEQPRSWLRVPAALLVGLTGSAIIWVTTPYVDCLILRYSSVAGSYLPATAVFLMLVILLVLNPLLRWLTPRRTLNKSQLALVLGMMLVASVLPSQGLLRQLPYSIANIPKSVSENQTVAKAYAELDPPRGLFPAKLAYSDLKEVPEASDYFVDQLPPGKTVPWDAWLAPLLAWGAFLLPAWFMMIGLAEIVFPQWRNNELLPFPLLSLQESLIEEPEQGRLFAPIFRSRGFWVGALIVFGLHALLGLAQYHPGRVPSIPIHWNFWDLFTEGIFRYTPGYLRYNKIYFIFLGVAFFMPSRIGFSIWFFQILYAGYFIAGNHLFPPFNDMTIIDHRSGATFAIAAVVLWLGRSHWVRVFSTLFRGAPTGEDKRNRKAAIMFLVGCIGMFVWFAFYVHVPWPWALFFVLFAFVISLVITRIVAETGMVFIRLHFWYDISFIKLLPISCLSLPVLFFARVTAILFAMGSRVSCATMATHAIGLDKDASPRRQWRTGVLLVLLLVVGLVVCGGTHLYMNYHHAASYDGESRPVNADGLWMFQEGDNDLISFQQGNVNRPSYAQGWHLGFGAALALVLEWLCLRTPLWPLHPVGLLMVNSYYANLAWVSVFFGWLSKVLVIRYGGPRLYRAARPFFIGVIMGEVFAAALWAIEPAIRVLMGLPYKIIEIQPY